MSQTVKGSAGKALVWAQRSLGIVILIALLLLLDVEQVYRTIAGANLCLIALAVLAVVPLIFTKALRWRIILASQAVQVRVAYAFLVYFGSLFIGYLTPGRLGEFVKAVYVSRDYGASSARAFSSALADRLFDLYALLVVGAAALLSLVVDDARALVELFVSSLLLVLPLVLFLNDSFFRWFSKTASSGTWGRKLFASGGWLEEMRLALRQMTGTQFLISVGLTAVAYAIFFGQCYLLALALDLSVGFVQVSYAIALGSLAALLPISISGLGTREAAIVGRLGMAGVPATAALGFSVLVFFTFYLAGGLMGMLAWVIKPLPLAELLSASSKR